MPAMPGCSTFRRIDDRVLRITKAGTPVPEASPAEWEGGVNRCAVQRPEMEMFAQCAATPYHHLLRLIYQVVNCDVCVISNK